MLRIPTTGLRRLDALTLATFAKADVERVRLRRWGLRLSNSARRATTTTPTPGKTTPPPTL
jgi:hypothetical protein